MTADPTPPRWIMVTRPDREGLMDELAWHYRRAPWVTVLADRRGGERRRRGGTRPVDRRGGERRGVASNGTATRAYRLVGEGDGFLVYEASGDALGRCPACGAAVTFELTSSNEPPMQLDVVSVHNLLPLDCQHRTRDIWGKPKSLRRIYSWDTPAPLSVFSSLWEAGVTLIELAVVLALLCILGLASIAALGNVQVVSQAKGASDQLVSAIRYTRQRAISEAQDYCIATRTTGGVGQYQIYLGLQSGGTSCTGSSVEGPVDLTGGATIDQVALRFTPVSSVDPVGPTTIAVTAAANGMSCTVTLTVTPEGGVQAPGASC
jgi:prepilin-type N-terminal cleavage/methylation domain-containing protein